MQETKVRKNKNCTEKNNTDLARGAQRINVVVIDSILSP